MGKSNSSWRLRRLLELLVAISAGLFLFFLKRFLASTSPFEAVAYFLLICFCSLVLALILSLVFSSFTGEALAKLFFIGSSANEPPPEYSHIKARILNGRIDEAIEELEGLLRDEPENHHAVDLLTDVLMDKLCDYAAAAEVLERYLERTRRRPDDGKLILKLSDAYIELDKVAMAVESLKREIAGNSKMPYATPLSTRLEALESARDG